VTFSDKNFLCPGFVFSNSFNICANNIHNIVCSAIGA
jgi:hypothetical protein